MSLLYPPYRQGDVLLLPVESIPAEATPVPRHHDRLVLQEGEATGHAHVITAPETEVSLYELVTPGDVAEMRRRFLRVENTVTLDHEEHHAITLPPGEYEQIRQYEHTPAALRAVND